MRVYASLPVALGTLSLVHAFDVRGSVIFDPVLSNSSMLPPTSKVSLDYGARQAFIRKDGTFELSNVQDGQHVLEPLVPGYSFNPFFLSISNTSIHIQPHHPARHALPTSLPSLPYPLQLRALGKEDYFTQPAGFNPLGMLKNPMVLMMLFSVVLMFGMPKLMASLDMDPEMAKDVAETRKKMQGMQNMDFMGSISNMLAGGAEADPAPAASSVSGTSTPSKATGGGGGGGNGAKRRKGR